MLYGNEINLFLLLILKAQSWFFSPICQIVSDFILFFFPPSIYHLLFVSPPLSHLLWFALFLRYVWWLWDDYHNRRSTRVHFQLCYSRQHHRSAVQLLSVLTKNMNFPLFLLPFMFVQDIKYACTQHFVFKKPFCPTEVTVTKGRFYQLYLHFDRNN